MWLNVGTAGVLVTADVALGDGLGIVGVLLAGMLVAVVVACGVTVGAAVGVVVVQAALIVAAAIKTNNVIDFLVILLLKICQCISCSFIMARRYFLTNTWFVGCQLSQGAGLFYIHFSFMV
jgi:hypothetical protein